MEKYPESEAFIGLPRLSPPAEGKPFPTSLQRSHVIVAVLLIVISATLFIGSLIGMNNSEHYVLVEQLLDHPFTYMPLAVGFAALAVWIIAQKPRLKSFAVALYVLGSFIWLSLPFVFGGASDEGLRRIPGPGNHGFELRVAEDRAVIDPIWEISIRTSGWLAREWPVACFNGDAGGNSFHSAEWTGPYSVTLQNLDGATFQFTFDSQTGQPDVIVTTQSGCF